MNEKTTERKLLTEIVTRLEKPQLFTIWEDLGTDSPLGKTFYQILQEDCPWNMEAALSADKLKELLKKELEVTRNYRREFYDALIYFVDRIEKTDAQVYNAIGMSRTLWYHLRDNKNAKTHKDNVLKMAIILKLDYWELYYLVNLAGYSLLPGNDDMDRVVSLCIRNKIYDVNKIDELLYEAGIRTLFSKK